MPFRRWVGPPETIEGVGSGDVCAWGWVGGGGRRFFFEPNARPDIVGRNRVRNTRARAFFMVARVIPP